MCIYTVYIYIRCWLVCPSNQIIMHAYILFFWRDLATSGESHCSSESLPAAGEVFDSPQRNQSIEKMVVSECSPFRAFWYSHVQSLDLYDRFFLGNNHQSWVIFWFQEHVLPLHFQTQPGLSSMLQFLAITGWTNPLFSDTVNPLKSFGWCFTHPIVIRCV